VQVLPIFAVKNIFLKVVLMEVTAVAEDTSS
jgi:hypothetical protein